MAARTQHHSAAMPAATGTVCSAIGGWPVLCVSVGDGGDWHTGGAHTMACGSTDGGIGTTGWTAI